MHIYFCGIGGAGLAPLAELSLDCGFEVSGSDREDGLNILELKKRPITVSFDQTGKNLETVYKQKNIDLFVYSSAIKKDHPELKKALQLGIKTVKRDGLLNQILQQKKLNLIAVAGTHGKTTTTAMIVWLFSQLNIPISYSIGSNISFGPAACYQQNSQFFVYECDEFDRNFLKFNPYLAIITSLDYDHPDTYLTKKDYFEAFSKFTNQSKNPVYLYDKDAKKLEDFKPNIQVISNQINSNILLNGNHNKQNACLAIKIVEKALQEINQDKSENESQSESQNNSEKFETNTENLIKIINSFPGTQRRLEKLSNNIYSDYAHHPSEIRATLQAVSEIVENNQQDFQQKNQNQAKQQIVVVYQPHQNVRQHLIAGEYQDCFSSAKKVFWLPTYLSREDENLSILSPQQLIFKTKNTTALPVDMDEKLQLLIQKEIDNNQIIVFMGAGSVDAWARKHWL